jgi:DNA helicase-2/ATP-dependent DNA helicase PcrA
MQPSSLSSQNFLAAVQTHLGKLVDPDQRDCVKAAAGQSLFIVAGPGTGKTTAITLRILRLIFVDQFDPASILATTFTNRAADELRSRILGWGTRLKEGLNQAGDLPEPLRDLDINRILTGTLDSIAEDALTTIRAPETPPPVLVQQFAADALMTHNGLLEQGRFRSMSLRNLALRLSNNTGYNFGFGQLRGFCSTARQRISQDQVDIGRYREVEGAADRGSMRLCDVLDDYLTALHEGLAVDFAGLEDEFLRRLQDGSMDEFTAPLLSIFVDEYQDTNFLQESIYFALLQQIRERNGTIAVVGDDDQSLYRFRGATVELFSDFLARCDSSTKVSAEKIYLRHNYRSTSNIIDFCNSYVNLDSSYIPARVTDKPPLDASRPAASYTNYPVLGLFRPTRADLATALTALLDDVFNGNGFAIPATNLRIRRNSAGTVADCALLSGSPREYDAQGRPRLPLLLRQALEGLTSPIRVFNPRGEEFHLVEDVQRLGGLLLECLDPGSRIQGDMRLPRDVVTVLDEWRRTARVYVATDPPPHRPNGIAQFVDDWQNRRARTGRQWPDEVPVAELLYKLATWLPGLVGDVQGLAYLEVFGRTIAEATRIVQPQVIQDPQFADGRIGRLIREIFAPLALGAIDVDEALLETLPGDHLSVFSVHQAKGLEFPMVIVDVGSDFPDNRPAPFRRYPRSPGLPPNLEDHFRRYSALNPPVRPPLDRAFDDLVRQYFVAFSRPKDLLLVTGLGDQTDGPLRRVKNIATGWTRHGTAGCLWDSLPHVVLI